MGGFVGRTLGRYEIVAFVGRGGMGEVFRARDTELGRDVAIKVLPPDTARNESRLERFKREARAVAQLSHPNILDIHDFGTEGGVTYSVTELLEGSDLRSRLAGHALPLSKVLTIGRAVAEGLAAAHGKGIVHRDVKPANIFLTRTGQVKILDFGIASLRSELAGKPVESGSPTVTLTKSGQVIGTTAYMAPEQVAGRPADARSDIFSLGCVMYEMLTGRQAFSGESPNETMVAIVSKDPVPISELRSDVPPALELLVNRCLEKEPDERFESARDVAFALRTMSQHPSESPTARRSVRRRALVLTAKIAVVCLSFAFAVWAGTKLAGFSRSHPPPLPSAKHLAIAPFRAVGDKAELAQLAAGIGEILAEDLEWLARRDPHDCWVVPAVTARDGHANDVHSLYRTFSVNLVLTGTVERQGPMLRFELASVEPATGLAVRTATVEADMGNVSSLQVDPVERAAGVVGIDLTTADREFFRARATNVARAFELYVRARGVLSAPLETRETGVAITLLEEAVKLDPLFAPARESLAQALTVLFAESGDQAVFERGVKELQTLTTTRPSENAFLIMAELYSSNGDDVRAITALESAVSLAPKDGAAFLKLGAAYQRGGRNADAEQAFQRSINLRPGYWYGPDSLGRLYISDGRYDAAANCFRQVVAAAPLNKLGYNLLGVILFFQDDLEASRLTFEQSIRVDPVDNYFAYANLGTLHFNAARFADAIVAYEQALAIADDDYQVWGNLAFAYAFGAEPEKSREPFVRAIELAVKRSEAEPRNPKLLADLAGYYAMVDERAKSASLLERVIALDPQDPQVFAKLGETYEDLNDRDSALMWIGRALQGGIPARVFDSRPMLRELVADPRFQGLVERHAVSPS